MNKIEIKNLKKDYQNFALKDVNFSIPAGYVTGFIGRNGMGKTTTIKSILSLIQYQGKILSIHDDEKTKLDNQKIGVIMDDSFLAKDWNMELVNQAMKVGYDKWEENTYWNFLEKFNIDRKLKVKELSRGMKIKLMLSIALSHNAELLILDEPTSGLDPSMREEFVEVISDYMQDDQHTVLFSTHITQDLETIADYIVFIDNGVETPSVTYGNTADERVFRSYRTVQIKASTYPVADGTTIFGVYSNGQLLYTVNAFAQ